MDLKLICGRSIALFAFCISCCLCVYAQEGATKFGFTTGEKFLTEVHVSSEAFVQRGMQKFEIKTSSETNREYEIMSKGANGYQLNVKITKLKNTMEALRKKMSYNSEDKLEKSSNITKSIDFMVEKPQSVSIDSYGKVKNYSAYKNEIATDTLVAFAGIQPVIFEKGVLLNFLTNFKYHKNLKKGYSWSDAVTIHDEELQTDFLIYDTNEKTTVVKFKTKIESRLLNTNSTGTYVVDNVSGIILEKVMYSISKGYQISAGKVLYMVTRSSSITGKTTRIP